MEQNKSLVLSKNRELTPTVWKMFSDITPILFDSRLFGIASKEKMIAIMLKGYELGLGITASFEFIDVIEGKPSLSPRGAMALIQAAGVLDDFAITDIFDKNGKYFGAKCYMKRGNTEYTSQFTLEDAKKALLTEGSPTSTGKRGYGNWEKYERNMCTWRVVGFTSDVICPDVTGGLTTFLKMPEAFPSVSVDDEGNFQNVIDVTPEVVSPVVSTITLNDLLKDYSAEAIMAANEGRIPASDEEIQVTIEKLQEVKNG